MTISPFASATELAASIREQRISSRAATELCVDRIQKHNPALHAIVVDNRADALQSAVQRDDDLKAGILRGPLHGVPVTVKESFNLSGHKTTVNFTRLKDNVAASDSFVVERLKEAGALILGKTNVPTMLSDYQSFGPLYPTANNPYDLARTPGGSTGGGAAAVAAGLTTLEIGGDIGGSIRVPAHFCGVFGLKPTETVPLHGKGHVPFMPGSSAGFIAMASFGPLARTMADIDLAWTILNRQAWHRTAHLPARPRVKTDAAEYKIAWFDDVGRVECGDETKQALASLVRALEAAGVACEKRPFDQRWLDEAYQIWGVLFGAILGQDAPWIARQLMKWHFGRMTSGVMNVAGPVKTGLSLDFKAFSQALKRRIDLVEELQRQFDEYDFIISPTAAGPAFRHNPRHLPIEYEGRMRAYMDYASPFVIIYNSAGNPVLVVPAGSSSDGLPIGVQIAAPHYAEADLIHFGALVERVHSRFAPPTGY
jgi:amidase